MTMTANEEKVLRNFLAQSHACGTLYSVVAVLAEVALKEAAIKVAQAPLNKDSTNAEG